MNKPGKVYYAPWEKTFERILTPLEEFIHRQTTSGILLMLCALLALIVANSPWGDEWHHLMEMPFSISLGGLQLSMSLHHWVNDGLMAMFFFVVGLELKRELLVGELSDPKRAALPIIAALGGMVVPALLYLAVNSSGSTSHGWGIPTATDIAFALGTLALLGNRVPASLLTFLVALAIVDDLGAVIVIALFYTAQLNVVALLSAALLLALLTSLNLGGVRWTFPYLLLGALLWLALLKSGVHATLAGVFLAFAIPLRPKFDLERFVNRAQSLLEKITALSTHCGESDMDCGDPIKNGALRGRITALANASALAQAPAQMLEHKLHIPSAYLVIPIFALANAAIPIDFGHFGAIFENSVALGVILGLAVGKVLGIAGAVWLAVSLGWSVLPHNASFRQLLGVSMLGGIGFTMSIFIASLAFADQPENLLMAKTGILLASLISGLVGYFWLKAAAK